ncbi:MAG: PIN domain-containing protein [Candidatus Korarchaeota archaeon]|nr:PIN domain-containing protein [Candidatus Korarchaeota archaeon]
MSFVLDTTSIIIYLSDLKGADLVEELLERASRGKAEVYVSYLTLAELYHIIGREYTARMANEAIVAVKRWPISLVPVDESIALSAGRIAIQSDLHLQDAVVVATAMDKKAAVVTSNPKIGEIFDDIIVLGTGEEV